MPNRATGEQRATLAPGRCAPQHPPLQRLDFQSLRQILAISDCFLSHCLVTSCRPSGLGRRALTAGIHGLQHQLVGPPGVAFQFGMAALVVTVRENPEVGRRARLPWMHQLVAQRTPALKVLLAEEQCLALAS
jgi:hypothetical protein